MSLYPLLCNSTKSSQFIFMIFISYNVQVYLTIHICTFMYVYLNWWPKKNGHLFKLNRTIYLCIWESVTRRILHWLEVLKDSQESIGLLNRLKTLNGFKAESQGLDLRFTFSPIFLCWHYTCIANFLFCFEAIKQAYCFMTRMEI